MAEAKDGAKPTLVQNIIALVGFFFLLILLIWALMNITSWMPGLFGWMNRTSSTLTISSSQSPVQSGTPTTIGWTHTAQSGTYAFSYECVAGARVQVTTAAGADTILPCATAYVVNADGPRAIQVVPLVDLPSISVPFTIQYRDADGTAGASAKATLVVNRTTAGNGGTATSTPNTPSQPNTPHTPTTPRVPDLAIRVVAIGILQNGQFVQTSQIRSSDVVSIRFEIKNTGGAATGSWSFNANLPSSTNPSYASAVQQSLNPGDRIVYTLSFDGMYQNGGLLSITADPGNSIREISELNNQLTYQLTMTGGYHQVQQQYQYGY